MKQLFFTILAGLLFALPVSAQFKKDGTPDMRYKANRQTYGSTYTYPSVSTTTNSSVRFQNGYVKSNGTYVQPHVKTNINSTNHDNFSSKDNYNLYNGTTGARAKDYTPDAYNYGKGKVINTGSKGGQYYYNNRGNKIYVPKRY